MGIIGYTHGVSEVSKPAVSANKKACVVPRFAASAKSSAHAVSGTRRPAIAKKTTSHRPGSRRARKGRRRNTLGIYHGVAVAAACDKGFEIPSPRFSPTSLL
jgi:hypothetical protein